MRLGLKEISEFMAVLDPIKDKLKLKYGTKRVHDMRQMRQRRLADYSNDGDLLKKIDRLK